MNIVLGIDYLVPKLKCAPIFMKFDTQDIFKYNLIT